MSKLSYSLEFNINEGQLDAFKAIASDCIAATEANEPGTLRYQWYLNADRGEASPDGGWERRLAAVP